MNNVIIGGTSVGITAFLIAGILLMTGDVLAYPQLGNATITGVSYEDVNTLRIDWEFYVYMNQTEHVRYTDRFYVPKDSSIETIEQTFVNEVNKTYNARFNPVVVNEDLSELQGVLVPKTVEEIVSEN